MEILQNSDQFETAFQLFLKFQSREGFLTSFSIHRKELEIDIYTKNHYLPVRLMGYEESRMNNQSELERMNEFFNKHTAPSFF